MNGTKNAEQTVKSKIRVIQRIRSTNLDIFSLYFIGRKGDAYPFNRKEYSAEHA